MIKEIFYDWGGINKKIFLFVNSIFGKSEYDQIMILADITGGHHNFGYHLSILLVLAGALIYKNKHDQNKCQKVTLWWLEILSTLMLSLFFSYIVIFEMKNLFEIARPFCTQDMPKIHTIAYIIDPVPCNHSFPSGHMAFVTVFVVVFWPFINRFYKSLAILLIIFIGISRMAAAAHYPADLLWALMLCTPITILTRHITKYVMQRYYKYYSFLLPWLKKDRM